jgi:hypothetical protein
VPVKRRGRNAESTGDIGDSDSRVGEKRPGNVEVIRGHFRWPASYAARSLRCRKPGARALPNESSLELSASALNM